MSLFQPITSQEALPIAGQGAETYSFDIKQDVKRPYDWFEMAKDVSAFANSTGGVILVGAAEDRKRGTIGRYLPLDEKNAKEIRDAYSKAVGNCCSPAPVINAVVLPLDVGHIVAVNVWPFPGQAIGVRHNGVPHTYAFPFRTGVDTVWLTAEQLPMLMVPELRRVIILLDAIPAGADLEAINFKGHRFQVRFAGMKPLQNVLIFTWSRPNNTEALCSIPLDTIQSVWKDDVRGWCLSFKGTLETRRVEEGKIIAIYMPQ